LALNSPSFFPVLTNLDFEVRFFLRSKPDSACSFHPQIQFDWFAFVFLYEAQKQKTITAYEGRDE